MTLIHNTHSENKYIIYMNLNSKCKNNLKLELKSEWNSTVTNGLH